ncbi:Gypsy retrotransposon integrase-like protein 1 [Vermiconidia calcicola]|uniref:Gypsy retrotransposon integrase-like protein 1 n=1 Tax=Vermiconidia calcicola TaxID=1690605 RepID=A0ACC3NDR6_9PEZI|nr:Gypsy retrotransposon integrase-like protein 1 [Vermiconidia calcicola]
MGCSYDAPDRRMTSVEYIQTLEQKVEELEGLLERDGPNDLDETSDPPTPSSRQDDRPWPASETPASSNIPSVRDLVHMRSGKPAISGADEDVIETMVGAGEHDSPHTSSFERYRGSFAGLSLLRRVHNLCKDVSTSQKYSDSEALQDDFIHAFDFASPNSDSSVPWEAYVMLPSRTNFDHAIDTVVNQACCNMQFLDRPALEDIAKHVYAESEGESRHQSRKPLALLYAVLALARRFEPTAAGEPASAQDVKGCDHSPFSSLELES